MGRYVSDIALVLVRAFSAALGDHTGKIEATRKRAHVSPAAEPYGARSITDWDVDA
jgi:hypothetical protein